MKSIYFSFLILASIATKAQSKIEISNVSKHLGDSVIVCSKVFGTKFLEQSASQITFINLGAAYPNSPLTVVVLGKDRPHFPSAPEALYIDKEVCASGVIKLNRERYEIVITKPSELIAK